MLEDIDVISFYDYLLLDVGHVPTVWFFCSFTLYIFQCKVDNLFLPVFAKFSTYTTQSVLRIHWHCFKVAL
jgi:hypothetical protein